MKTFCLALCICALVSASAVAEDKKDAPPAGASAAAGTVVTPAEVAKLIAEKKATILDIRTPEEFAEGHLPDAVNIDYMSDDFARKIAALDKTKTYVVHCGAGSRSTKSLPALEQAGLKSVLHLQQGFKGWQSAGQPIEKP